MPFGSSPISPLLCAPIGLKYLRRTTFHSGSAVCRSVRICSSIHFVHPYGFVQVPFGHSSVIGINAGSPYTVAEELKMLFFTPWFLITSQSVIVPPILFS